ncbi:MAG TPA: histone deacetylase [Polyangiaceae bacterium]|nr:histone deacetylase [Polyangiaceae bacterium]
MENTIAVVSDPLFTEGHRTPEGHPERPERLGAAAAALSEARLGMERRVLAPRDATDDELARVHEPAYVEALSRASGRRGYLDADTYCSEGSVQAAKRAAGGAVALVDSLLDGNARLALALVRPPGHHARPGTAMGFCLLNNVAVAAAHARSRGCEKVAIVDFDVHHGNGTQEMFYEDPSVLYVSLHQWPYYPGTGAAEEAGAGDGLGATLNVPLSAGAGDAAYLAAFDRIVCPALEGFSPDLLLVSAGFDAHRNDPLAAMRVTEAGYSGMMRRLAALLPDGGAGRVGLVLEGGYGLDGLRDSLRATLEALEAPGTESAQGTLSPTEEADLARARAVAARFHALS